MKRSNALKAMLAGVLVCATAVFAAESSVVKGNPKSKVYHKSTCKYYASKGSTAEFATEAEAVKAGYKPCKRCAAPKADKTKKSEQK